MGDVHLLWVTDIVSKFPTSILSYYEAITYCARHACRGFTHSPKYGGWRDHFQRPFCRKNEMMIKSPVQSTAYFSWLSFGNELLRFIEILFKKRITRVYGKMEGETNLLGIANGFD